MRGAGFRDHGTAGLWVGAGRLKERAAVTANVADCYEIDLFDWSERPKPRDRRPCIERPDDRDYLSTTVSEPGFIARLVGARKKYEVENARTAHAAITAKRQAEIEEHNSSIRL